MFEYRSLKNWKYQLTKTYKVNTGILPDKAIDADFIKLSASGVLTIKKLYSWDGATGAVDTPNFRRASCAHDCFCQLIAEGALNPSYRKKADELLQTMCIEDGMSRLRAAWVYYAVRSYVRLVK